MKSLFSLIIGMAVVLSNPLAGSGGTKKGLAAGELITICEPVEGTRVKRGKVLGVIDAPPYIVWEVITDNNHFKDFMPHTLESLVVNKDLMPLVQKRRPENIREVKRIIGKPVDPRIYQIKGGKYSIYFYSLLDFPLPISNKWYIIKIDHDETRAAEGIYQSSWDMVTGNLRSNQGFWLLEPYGKSQTKVTYSLLTDPGGYMPDFFINMGTKKTMPDVIQAVRNRARELMRQEQLGSVILK